ncbi:MAG: hypothetical protein M3164_04760 [Actinomycetota bacterium]|nr:hypothetical protein [Actinomycetota bacterium]
MDEATFERSDGCARSSDLAHRLAGAIDPRLADVWACLFAHDVEGDRLGDEVGWYLRMAYLQGYVDGLTEPRRGSLLADLGLEIPERAAEGRKGARG